MVEETVAYQGPHNEYEEVNYHEYGIDANASIDKKFSRVRVVNNRARDQKAADHEEYLHAVRAHFEYVYEPYSTRRKKILLSAHVVNMKKVDGQRGNAAETVNLGQKLFSRALWFERRRGFRS
jgi:hypothetical protein